MGSKKICTISCCDKPLAARGYCSAHYARFLKGQELNSPIIYQSPNKKKDPTKCKVEDCTKLSSLKGFCDLHYRRNRVGIPLQQYINRRYHSIEKCSVGECDRIAESLGFCSKHYTRMKKGLNPELKSMRESRPFVLEAGTYKVPLNKEYTNFAIVDIGYKYLEKYFWHMSSHGYAVTNIEGKRVYLAHIIQEHSDQTVDHINRNKLDNRRINLRSVSYKTNNYNRDIKAGDSSWGESGRVGVRYDKDKRRWFAYGTFQNTNKLLKRFKTFEEAVKARESFEDQCKILLLK